MISVLDNKSILKTYKINTLLLVVFPMKYITSL